jgi:hypothetical protein
VLQDPSKTNGDNLNNVTGEDRHFRNKKRKYTKDKMNMNITDL